jgi:hypothetical protein
MINSQLVFRNDYRWDLKKVKSVLIPYLFDNDASLIITVEPKSRLAKDYTLAGKLDQVLIDYPNRLVASSQVISLSKNYQVNFPQEGRFQLEFFPYSFLGRTIFTVSKMFSSSNNRKTTYAQPAASVAVDNTKKLIVAQQNERSSYLLINAGTATVYFKYVPIGADFNTVTVSDTEYDFLLTADEKFLDAESAKNAVVGVTSGNGKTATLKITEYFYA